MLHVRNLAALISIVVLLASCSGNNSDSLPSVVSQATSTGTITTIPGGRSTNTLSSSASRHIPPASFLSVTANPNSRRAQSINLTSCPSGQWCVAQGQSIQIPWTNPSAAEFGNLTTTSIQLPPGVTAIYAPNPSFFPNYPTTETLSVASSVPVGVIQNSNYVTSSTYGTSSSISSMNVTICNGKTGSCVPCVPKPTSGPNVLKEIPVLDKNGNPILGANGTPAVRPDDGQDFQFYATEALTLSVSLDTIQNQLSNFRAGGPWDEQRVGSTNGQITDNNFVNISTINIGVYGAIVGIPETLMQAIQEVYSATHNSLQPGQPAAPGYPGLGLRNYQNMDIGYKLVQNGMIIYNNLLLFCS